MATVITLCVGVCARARATGHIFYPKTKNLIFWLNDPWDMGKKLVFLFFEILTFMDFFENSYFYG